MKKKHKKKLFKLLVSMLAMLVVTITGYYSESIEKNINDLILIKPRNRRSII